MITRVVKLPFDNSCYLRTTFLITAYYISITLLGHGAASGIKFDGGTRASDKLKLVAMILPHINTIGDW